MEKNNKWITLQKSKIIISQMENNICKIILDNCQYFAFLSKIFYPKKNKFIPILITIPQLIFFFLIINVLYSFCLSQVNISS